MSKNTYTKGFEAEQLVLQLLLQNNYEILQRRYRTPFAEIDILIRGKRQQLVIIEVKMRAGTLNDRPVMSEFQKSRLKRSMSWLINQGHETELWLAVVGQDRKIQFFQDVFD